MSKNRWCEYFSEIVEFDRFLNQQNRMNKYPRMRDAYSNRFNEAIHAARTDMPYIIRIGNFTPLAMQFSAEQQRILDWCEENFIDSFCHGIHTGIACKSDVDAMTLKLAWETK